MVVMTGQSGSISKKQVIQILTSKLCEWCGQGCGIPCEPLQYILQAYDRQRTDDKKELLKILRNDIEIIDYEPSRELEELGNKVIDKIEELGYIRDFEIKIGYVLSYERKSKDGRIVYADCRKVTGPYRAYLPYDFLITFYEPNIALLSDNQQKVVMWHELRHTGMGIKGTKLQPHEIENFYSICEQLGIHYLDMDNDVIDILEGGGREKANKKEKRNQKAG